MLVESGRSGVFRVPGLLERPWEYMSWYFYVTVGRGCDILENLSYMVNENQNYTLILVLMLACALAMLL